MHDADHVVDIGGQHGEPREAGLPRQSSTASAVSCRSTVSIRTRGVITSAASRSANRNDRPSSAARSTSNVPSIADRRTSELNSSAVRAPESSSCGSMPRARTTTFAVWLRTSTNGLKIVVNPACSGTTIRATRTGTAMAKFFGTSSPKSIEPRVATTTPVTSRWAHRRRRQARRQ